MVPVAIVGLVFKDEIKGLFSGGNLIFVGSMLILTSVLLGFTYFSKPKNKDTGFLDALIIGLAQAVAVLPGVSRSGTTIATGLMLGNKKELVAKFSFLMVIVPILGENILGIFKGDFIDNSAIGPEAILTGFLAAFISGVIACKWMIRIVQKGKLIYFAAYCLLAGSLAIILG